MAVRAVAPVHTSPNTHDVEKAVKAIQKALRIGDTARLRDLGFSDAKVASHVLIILQAAEHSARDDLAFVPDAGYREHFQLSAEYLARYILTPKDA